MTRTNKLVLGLLLALLTVATASCAVPDIETLNPGDGLGALNDSIVYVGFDGEDVTFHGFGGIFGTPPEYRFKYVKGANLTISGHKLYDVTIDPISQELTYRTKSEQD